MKYIVYGVNRIAKDFIYIFDGIDILYLTDAGDIPAQYAGYQVKKFEDALADASYDQIILCNFDKAGQEEELQKRGLVYGTDYVYEEDFFTGLDDISVPDEKKVVVWGTGNMCRMLMGENLPWRIDAFIDSNKKRDMFMGRPVFLPEDIPDWETCYVIVAVAEDEEIRDTLMGHGLLEDRDFISYRKVLELPSVLLRKTMFDRTCYNLECNTMRNHLEILDRGSTRYCCTTFVNRGIGSILGSGMEEIWNSKRHKIMCLSTENRTFSFCDKRMCPLFVGRASEAYREDDRVYRNPAPVMETLAVGFDPSCNLSCGTCRKGLHFAEGRELEMVNRVTERIMDEYLRHCKFLIMAGNGEVFVSPAYRRIYESAECNPQFIRLLSNGTLFNRANWERFRKGKTGKIMLTVSVDAATKETYERIRRNGNFDMLKKNMEFASGLRKKGELCYFRMNFVVQRENYREMVPFVEWGEKLGLDEVFFTKILNWGTYTEEEFDGVSMMERDGVTPKPELKEVLEHPVMKSGIVDLGTIQYGHKVDEASVVENYYMWELEKRGGRLFC